MHSYTTEKSGITITELRLCHKDNLILWQPRPLHHWKADYVLLCLEKYIAAVYPRWLWNIFIRISLCSHNFGLANTLSERLLQRVFGEHLSHCGENGLRLKQKKTVLRILPLLVITSLGFFVLGLFLICETMLSVCDQHVIPRLERG